MGGFLGFNGAVIFFPFLDCAFVGLVFSFFFFVAVFGAASVFFFSRLVSRFC